MKDDSFSEFTICTKAQATRAATENSSGNVSKTTGCNIAQDKAPERKTFFIPQAADIGYLHTLSSAIALFEDLSDCELNQSMWADMSSMSAIFNGLNFEKRYNTLSSAPTAMK